MMTSMRKDSYKHAEHKSVSEIRFSANANVQTERKNRRERLLTSKRMKVEDLEAADAVLTAQEERAQVEDAVRLLKQGRKLDALSTLHKSFARDETNGETFILTEGLPPLKSCFFSASYEVLHAAAWCAVNLTAGSSPSAHRVISLSPILIQFLQGSDTVMQELCAWALGNLAADLPQHRQTLMRQGCIPSLVELVSTSQCLSHAARTQSVLFSLTNLARGSQNCVRCIQEHLLFQHITMMLNEISVKSELCLELGWLINSIYGRKEVFRECRGQYPALMHLVLDKLSQALQLEDGVHKENVTFPYLRCLGNLIGQCSSLAVISEAELSVLAIVTVCLRSQTDFFREEGLGILTNFIAEPSCCVLVMCQPRLLTAIINLCLTSAHGMSTSALGLIERMTRISVAMSEYLIDQRMIPLLGPLLASGDTHVVDAVINIFTELVHCVKQAKVDLRESDASNLLNVLISNPNPDNITEKARCLIDLIKSDVS